MISFPDLYLGRVVRNYDNYSPLKRGGENQGG